VRDIHRYRLLAGLVVLALLFAPRMNGHISDQQLLRYAASSFDPREMSFQHVVLGDHNGMRVVADFPCADLCPAYTTRVIHYDVEPGGECEAHDGVTRSVDVPVGVGMLPVPFCVPKVLVEAPMSGH
jgi:hypothetical protein